MAINLHSKYSDQLAKLYTKNSFVEGHTNNRWSFSGFKSIYIPSITTQPLNDYQRSGTSRYGTPKDLQDTVLEMTIHEGKNREIRRMCEAVGLEVIRLKRNAEGAVKLGMLQPGQYRELTKAEINALRAAGIKGANRSRNQAGEARAAARKARSGEARRPAKPRNDK